LLNGCYLIAGSLTRDWRNRFFGTLGLHPSTTVRRTIMWASTFLLTCLAWIVFRAQSLPDATYIVTHLASGWDFRTIGTPNFLLRQMPVAIGAILVLEIGQAWHRQVAMPALLGRWPLPVRWAAYAGFVMAVVMLGVYRGTEFIYFQF
jgi:hypothetical protein